MTCNVKATAIAQNDIEIKIFKTTPAVVIVVLTDDGTETFAVISNNTITSAGGAPGASTLLHIVGICAARGRMAAWDVANALYWGASINVTDFEPSLTTRANTLTVDAVKGEIKMLRYYDEGFLIAATGNIVKASYENSQVVFKFKSVHPEGIVNPSHIQNQGDFVLAWTKSGLIKHNPNTGNNEYLYPELLNWLRTLPIPVRVINMGHRYLGLAIRKGINQYTSRNTDQVISATLPRPQGSTFLTAYPEDDLLSPISRIYVYDTVLDKLGIIEDTSNIVFSLDPINQSGYGLTRDYAFELTNSDGHRSLGCIGTDGITYIYNDNPADSELVVGKYQMSRSGKTRLTDVIAEYVGHPNNTITVERSENGRSIADVAVSSNNTAAIQNCDLTPVGKWFNIVFKGRFNIRRILIRGFKYAIR